MSERKTYETQDDLQIENELKINIEEITGWKLYKLPRKYGADFLAFKNDDPVEMIEIKNRANDMNTYKTYLLSLHKVVTTLAFAEFINVNFMLFVRWKDHTGYIELNKYINENNDLKIRMLITNYRNDSDDLEPCLHIPISNFILIK